LILLEIVGILYIDLIHKIIIQGAKSALTLAATRMMELCGQRLTDKEERFMRLEKAINPLLDDNDQVISS
jgi:transcription initiation factor TFIID subunit 1